MWLYNSNTNQTGALKNDFKPKFKKNNFVISYKNFEPNDFKSSPTLNVNNYWLESTPIIIDTNRYVFLNLHAGLLVIEIIFFLMLRWLQLIARVHSDIFDCADIRRMQSCSWRCTINTDSDSDYGLIYCAIKWPKSDKVCVSRQSALSARTNYNESKLEIHCRRRCRTGHNTWQANSLLNC